MAIYWVEHGECVNQSFRLDVDTIEEAKDLYLDEMDDRDCLVETDGDTEFVYYGRNDEYRWPDEDTCVRVVKLRHLDDSVEDMDSGWYWVEDDEWEHV